MFGGLTNAQLPTRRDKLCESDVWVALMMMRLMDGVKKVRQRSWCTMSITRTLE